MKLTYNLVKKMFEDENCKLAWNEKEFEDKYKNSLERNLEYVCCCGLNRMTSVSNFKSGKRCKDCGRKKQIDSIKKFDLDENLISSMFVNGSTVEDVANFYKCSESLIYQFVKKNTKALRSACALETVHNLLLRSRLNLKIKIEDGCVFVTVVDNKRF